MEPTKEEILRATLADLYHDITEVRRVLAVGDISGADALLSVMEEREPWPGWEIRERDEAAERYRTALTKIRNSSAFCPESRGIAAAALDPTGKLTQMEDA